MAKLDKESVEKLREVVASDEFENSCCMIVLSNRICATVGTKKDLMVSMSACLQQLVYNDQFTKEDVEWIFNSVEFDKKQVEKDIKNSLKEMLDSFMEGLKDLKDEIEKDKEEK